MSPSGSLSAGYRAYLACQQLNRLVKYPVRAVTRRKRVFDGGAESEVPSAIDIDECFEPNPSAVQRCVGL
ncbi:MAG: hypothetical protein KC482_14480, partial [Dehalococcoidia bacterium]|nr:hypothetical protein [Dehalococcoidia bacterium]